jgi:hypothetical protein
MNEEERIVECEESIGPSSRHGRQRFVELLDLTPNLKSL